ncbi:CDP-glycerol glycerophosphotransferase [Fictibacillus solisalsi]|uniref:CDP-glycerol glycerophosphotransferase n=1 Tax=Fictibacillus solisalsi TaxID=459525 RepID=A0A1G9Y1C2_9BACL|nr:CDP-glycerol glycerophosphotransferase family protein [Fictibacillus solisalsi]SDN02800.1 CDP-glycerol glycerophosphotransferase [Fictibacillus solisalsi]
MQAEANIQIQEGFAPTKKRKCILHTIEFNENVAIIKYLLKNNAIFQEPLAGHLLLIERITGRELEFPFTAIEAGEKYYVLESTLDPLEIGKGSVWDAYVIIHAKQVVSQYENENGEDELKQEDTIEEYEVVEKKYRMKTKHAYLELSTMVQPETKQAITPYTTNKGNLSFKVYERRPVIKVENAELDKRGNVTLEGFYFFPFSSEKEGLERTMVIGGPEGFEERVIPFETAEREDLNPFNQEQQPFKIMSFMAQLDSKGFCNLDTNSTFRLYFKWEDEDSAGPDQDDLAIPLQLISFKRRVNQSIIISTVSGKKKVSLVTRKKTRSLVIKVVQYSLLQELKKKVRRTVAKVKQHKKTKKAYMVAFKLAGYLPVKKNLVMFESFLGKQYSCNPRAIYEYLKESRPDLELVWSVDGRSISKFEDAGIPYAKRFSVKWLFKMARARYWVTNSRMPLWIPKAKHTVYFQTWHGTPLKRLAADMDEVHMPGTNTKKYKANFHKESSKWDYLLSPNAYSTEIFRRAFNFHKEVVEVGYPRNDVLYTKNNPSDIKELKEKLQLPQDKKVILYAPTWRDDQFYGKGRYKFDLELDLLQLKDKFGEDYVIVLRMHYLVAENFDLSPYEGFAFDFSYHGDINELYLVSDIMITDYSSVFFDYANLKRPMLFFVYDIESYRDKLRGFYFDFETYAPGPLVKTTDEVISAIEKIESDGFEIQSEIFDDFYERFCYLESGQSSHKAVQKVF